MTMIPPVGASTATSGTTGGQAPGNPLSQLDNSQTFLQLLVAQLKYQDPLNPTDPSQFMAQTAQLSQVEAVTQEVNQQEAASATSMLGDQVTATVKGSTVTGVPTAVLLGGSGGPTLEIGSTQVPLSDITKVTPAPAAGSGGSGSGTTTSTGTTSTSTSSGGTVA